MFLIKLTDRTAMLNIKFLLLLHLFNLSCDEALINNNNYFVADLTDADVILI